MAKYRGNPLIGISPKPKVVKVLIESIIAFKIFIKKSYAKAIKNTIVIIRDLLHLFLAGISVHLPLMKSIFFKIEAVVFVPETAHL